MERIQIPAIQKSAPGAIVSDNPFYQSIAATDKLPSSTDNAEERIATSSSDRPDIRNQVNYPVNLESVTNAYMPAKISKKKVMKNWVWINPNPKDTDDELSTRYTAFKESGITGVFFEADSERHFRAAKAKGHARRKAGRATDLIAEHRLGGALLKHGRTPFTHRLQQAQHVRCAGDHAGTS